MHVLRFFFGGCLLMGSDILPSLIIIVICIILSAYFSATETAFSSLNKTKIKTMAEKGQKRAKLVCNLVDEYDKLISTILIGNNIVNILLSSIGTVLFVKIYGNLGATISTVVVTIVVLIFGEITPKSIAKDFPEKFAVFSAPLINFFIIIFTPLNFIFTQWKKFISKFFRIKKDIGMSQEELLMFVEEVQQDGSIDENEEQLLKNIIEFSDISAEDILTHRVDVEAVPIDISKDELINFFAEKGFSRVPVYRENIDDIVGVINQKDFFIKGVASDKDITNYMTKAYSVPRNMKIDKLLKVFQKDKIHMAIVLDDLGGTLGIVTMEDILEEIVGEIWDEYDIVVEDFYKMTDSKYRVNCDVSLDDFFAKFDLQEDESDSNTLSGWIAEKIEKIPEVGDVYNYDKVKIKVVAVEKHRADVAEVYLN